MATCSTVQWLQVAVAARCGFMVAAVWSGGCLESSGVTQLCGLCVCVCVQVAAWSQLVWLSCVACVCVCVGGEGRQAGWLASWLHVVGYSCA